MKFNQNYQHQHINYSHTIYSKEPDTPKHFYQTYTDLDIENNILYHHHHVYHVEYISNSLFSRDDKEIAAVQALTSLQTSIEKETFLAFYHDYDLRKKIKQANPSFSLAELDDYMRKQWKKMTPLQQEPWKKKTLQSMFITNKDQPDSVENQSGLVENKQGLVENQAGSIENHEPGLRKIDINIRKYRKYTPQDLINKCVYLKNQKGRVVGLYRRKGKNLRFRVNWGDRTQLYYKKNIIDMLVD